MPCGQQALPLTGVQRLPALHAVWARLMESLTSCNKEEPHDPHAVPRGLSSRSFVPSTAMLEGRVTSFIHCRAPKGLSPRTLALTSGGHADGLYYSVLRKACSSVKLAGSQLLLPAPQNCSGDACLHPAPAKLPPYRPQRERRHRREFLRVSEERSQLLPPHTHTHIYTLLCRLHKRS